MTDLDFAGYCHQKLKIAKLMKELGYSIREDMLIHEGRYFFQHPIDRRRVDVFLDKLSMNHKIDFEGRLEREYPTIPLADLLLEKMQIVQITEKDIKDALLLLRANEVASDDDGINASYVADVLSRDWGFYYTAMTNLKKLLGFARSYAVLTEEDRRVIEARIESLIKAVELKPKSSSWRLRARLGPSIRWYNEVGQAER